MGTDVRDSRKTESTTDWLFSGRQREGHREQEPLSLGAGRIAVPLTKMGGPGGALSREER